MKGQFMIISSVIAGLLIISTASTVTKIQSREYSTASTGYILNSIQEEAQKMDVTDENERRNFRKMLSMIDRFETSANYWQRPSKPNCINVTLKRPGTELFLNCIG